MSMHEVIGLKKTNIGGSALIEGIMMKGPEDIAIAVRTPNGEIIVDKKPIVTLSKKWSFFKAPIIRGAVGIIETMLISVKALMYSADFFEIEEEVEAKPSKLDKLFENKKFKDATMVFSVFLALILGAGLFIILPNLVANILHLDKTSAKGVILYNLFEGTIRIILFTLYISLISKMKDIERVFQYHGAEHKTIHCYENEEELTVENVRKYSTRHPRCGTAFLLTVMVISILVFSFVRTNSIWINIFSRILLIPLIAGISYEIIKYSGRVDNKLTRIISAPGLAFQRFTTSEPDDSQIEVAIVALKNVIVEDKDADKW